MSITRAVVVGDTEGVAYRQDIRVEGHTLVADEPVLRGGADAGPTPSGYLLAALGACTSITLRIYAEKKGWSIGTVTVTLDLYPKRSAWKSGGPWRCRGRSPKRSAYASRKSASERRSRSW